MVGRQGFEDRRVACGRLYLVRLRHNPTIFFPVKQCRLLAWHEPSIPLRRVRCTLPSPSLPTLLFPFQPRFPTGYTLIFSLVRRGRGWLGESRLDSAK